MKFETAASVRSGVLRLADRAAVEAAFQGWPDGEVWATFQSAIALRSKQQNAYWHAAIVRPLAAHCRVTARQMHDALTVKLLPDVVMLRNAAGDVVESITIGGSTSTLTPNEAANLIDRGDRLVVDAGLGVPAPPLVTELPDPFKPCPKATRHWFYWIGPYTEKCKHCGAVKHAER